MKKKNKAAGASDPLEEIRAHSAYAGFRFFFGLPFYLLGGFIGMGALLGMAVGLTGDAYSKLVVLGAGALAFFLVMFILSIPAALGAIFDIADCSIRSDKRDADKAQRDAYEAYRKNQEATL